MIAILSLFTALLYPLIVIVAAISFITINPTVAFWAIVGGLLPAVIWLIFWLQEDRLHPEPKKVIFRSFAAGMIAVLIAVALERVIQLNFPQTSFLTFILFAIVEEVLKYLAAHFSCLTSKENDEPIDPVIYMISAALGFAALENTFFLNTPLLQNNVLSGLVTGNLRFLGANLLHVICSATIGIFIAFAFYKPKWQKRLYLVIGIALAVLLHALFNFSIINAGENLFFIFGAVWLCIIILILVFEKVKKIKPTKL